MRRAVLAPVRAEAVQASQPAWPPPITITSYVSVVVVDMDMDDMDDMDMRLRVLSLLGRDRSMMEFWKECVVGVNRLTRRKLRPNDEGILCLVFVMADRSIWLYSRLVDEGEQVS